MKRAQSKVVDPPFFQGAKITDNLFNTGSFKYLLYGFGFNQSGRFARAKLRQKSNGFRGSRYQKPTIMK
jgi:hypothetical protein